MDAQTLLKQGVDKLANAEDAPTEAADDVLETSTQTTETDLEEEQEPNSVRAPDYAEAISPEHMTLEGARWTITSFNFDAWNVKVTLSKLGVGAFVLLMVDILGSW